MVFSSLEFIFGFLPLFLIFYYSVAPKFKNTVLFLGSLIFYAFGEPVFILLIMLSVIVNYYGAILIDKFEKRGRKITLVLFLLYNFLMLGFFKYTNFFIENLNGIFYLFKNNTHIEALNIMLPLGISFYTFQIVSYIVDVYRKKVEPSKNIINVGAYLCMFPQLIAGPIVVYSDIEKELKSRTIKMEAVEDGLKTFIWGLSFKVLIANMMGIIWNDIQTIGFFNITTPYAWIGAIAYSFQIYFDFAGYSLMAIGLGKMLGFTIPENFRDPYIAKSVTEFWRRWHITLSSWFRDYVYIPLGGNRRGNIRTVVNLFIVWSLTGFWHGASWNFVLWGVYFFVFLTLEKLFLKKLLDKSRVLSRIFTLLVVVISWVIFAITDFSELTLYLSRMFPFFGESGVVNPSDYINSLKNYWYIFLSAIMFSTPLPKKLFEKYKKNPLCIFVLLALFWLCIYRLFTSANNPFLYFRF